MQRIILFQPIGVKKKQTLLVRNLLLCHLFQNFNQIFPSELQCCNFSSFSSQFNPAQNKIIAAVPKVATGKRKKQTVKGACTDSKQ